MERKQALHPQLDGENGIARRVTNPDPIPISRLRSLNALICLCALESNLEPEQGD
jgi:hypothetical protein